MLGKLVKKPNVLVFSAETSGSSLTCVRRVGGGSVEETWGSRDAQVGHPGSVSVHGGGDGVVVGLLGCGARHVPARRHAVRVTRVTWNVRHGDRLRRTLVWTEVQI